MLFHAPSSGTPAFNLAEYPYAGMSLLHQTNLKASACANNAQEALKRSGYSGVGSDKPGNGLFGKQGAYVAGIEWDAKRGMYYTFVAGPDRATVLQYEKTAASERPRVAQKLSGAPREASRTRSSAAIAPCPPRFAARDKISPPAPRASLAPAVNGRLHCPLNPI